MVKIWNWEQADRCCCLPTPFTLASGGGESDLPTCSPPASISVHLAGFVHIKVTTWYVCECRLKEDMCCVSECYKVGIVVMDVICRRLCVSMIRGRVIYLF